MTRDDPPRRTGDSGQGPSRASLLVERFVYPSAVQDMRLPDSADVRLVLAEAGWATMSTRSGERRSRYDWAPGRLGLLGAGQPLVCSYRAAEQLRSVQVGIPEGTVEQAAEQLGSHAVDYERIAVSLLAGDPLLEEAVRAVGAAAEVAGLYAESAATFMAVHLLTRHSGAHPVRPVPVREDARVRAVVALMRDRLAEPLSLSDIADEVHLSVFHLVRVFRQATGETPHRFLTRLRVKEAQRLLRDSDLPITAIAPRCGFVSPGALSAAFLRYTGMRPSAYRAL